GAPFRPQGGALLRQITLAVVVFAISSTTTVRSQSPAPPAKRPLPDFDIRELELANGRSNDHTHGIPLLENRTPNLTSFVESPETVSGGKPVNQNTHGFPKSVPRWGAAVGCAIGFKPRENRPPFSAGSAEHLLTGRSRDRSPSTRPRGCEWQCKISVIQSNAE